MNILYINHYGGGPQYGMEYRPFYLAREWLRAGHEVTIVAASHSHVRSKEPGTMRGLSRTLAGAALTLAIARNPLPMGPLPANA